MEIIGQLALVFLAIGITDLIVPWIAALLALMLKHWIISAITLTIEAFLLYKGIRNLREARNPCRGCWECDPQAFVGEDGELHPGL